MKNINVKSLFLCAVYSGALFAVTVKNEDILKQRLSIVILYNQLQKKNNKKKVEELPCTTICAFNPTGEIFTHGYDPKESNHKFHDVYDAINGIRVRQSQDSLFRRSVVYSRSKLNYFISASINTRDYGYFAYHMLCDMKETIWYWNTQRDPVKTMAFSPGESETIGVCGQTTYSYNIDNKKAFKWSRSGGKHATFLNETYMVSIPEEGSKASIFSIEENPKESFLEQGDGWKPQQVVLSHDEKTLAIASTYSRNGYLLTKIILYDAQSLKVKNVLYVPGELFSGRTEQHEKISFSPDDKRIFMHTLTQNDGVNSWSFDVNSNNDFLRIKHNKETKKLYELCGDYHFGGIDGKKSLIFDIRYQNRTIDMKIENPSHIALNPNVDSKIKAIVAIAGTTNLSRYPTEGFL